MIRAALRTRALLLLVCIGVLDLISTAVLHARGQIVELNPVMRPFLNHSEWEFAFVKGLTLGFAWFLMRKYAHSSPRFVRNVCLAGCLLYVGIWVVGFAAGNR